MLEDLGLYPMNFLSWNKMIYSKCKCVKAHHLWNKSTNLHIFDVQIQDEKKHVSFHWKACNTMNFLIFFYSFHSKPERGVVRGCRWSFLLTCHLLSGLWWSGRTTTGAISGCASTRSMGSWETNNRKIQRQTETSDGSGFLDGERALQHFFGTSNVWCTVYYSISFISCIHRDVQEYTQTFFLPELRTWWVKWLAYKKTCFQKECIFWNCSLFPSNSGKWRFR